MLIMLLWFVVFVIVRNTQPRFQFIVMNRRNTGSNFFLIFWFCSVKEDDFFFFLINGYELCQSMLKICVDLASSWCRIEKTKAHLKLGNMMAYLIAIVNSRNGLPNLPAMLWMLSIVGIRLLCRRRLCSPFSALPY